MRRSGRQLTDPGSSADESSVGILAGSERKIEYERRVARLAAEVADVRAEAFLRAPVGGRVVMVQREAGRGVLFGLAPVGSGTP